ncbi:MAG TPA: NAD(P)-dependent oxidoreductase [Xanthobacteraceae bacterium]|jgi:UDP-glucuronate 4-epimerase|nr:MAG: NAD-dependent epimerase/dehydratase [Rhizobiales bacterium 12-66-7]OYY82750.1 MAG: NAD-dependent epimerase/dehydratase [Rhizobiales bacterium 35-66-30]OZA96004.1 MAG: NAD-dependent epimerase/dehydratase [Rhizobiales bacterium 39-66-18]HQS09123.1 NAD(P)-dependent oxidoreductase [Xanthobacteraceae bacterium]HQS49091.1 NAD(P)-dependent oxidoreductase [Xanthobacteraceae bacterium]
MGVFVTGSSGFIGLTVCEALLARGERVVGYDLAPPPPMADALFQRLPGRFQWIAGDARDEGALTAALGASGADRLLILAAVTADAQRERSAPRAVIDVNVGGVASAMAAASATGIRRIVYLGSGSAYGASGRGRAPLDEVSTPLQPEGLYGISKQAGEAVALRLAGLHGLDLVVGRLGTCFGPWEYATSARDTPSAPFQVLRRVARGEEVVLPRPHPRDWFYGRDAAAAILGLMDTPRLPHPVYNLSAGFIWSLADFCRALALRRPGLRWRFAAPDEAGNVDLYMPYDRAPMANARLRADTGFAPRHDLPTALDAYLAWLDAAGAHWLTRETAP